MKQMKKILAAVCALAMVVTGITVAEPIKAETASSVEIVGGFSANTGIETLTGDFDVTYTFNNASTGTANHDNFIVEIRTEDGAGCFDLRADRYGWGWGTCQAAVDGNIQWAEPSEEFWFNWDNWVSDMKDADCTVNIVRTGDVITVSYEIVGASGKVTKTTATMPELSMLGETVTTTITGEKVKLTDIVFTNDTPGATAENPVFLGEETSTHTIPVGTKYFIGFFHGTTMTVTAEGDYKVSVDGTEYTPVDGVATVEIPASQMMGRPMPLDIRVVNNGTKPISAELVFAYPEGTQNNPEDIEAGTYEATFEAGAAEYYYNWTAPSEGTVTIGVACEGGWQYVVNNMTTGKYGDSHWSDDETVVSSEVLEVAEGDVIEIKVITYDSANPYAPAPAGKVTTTVDFEAKMGTASSPIFIDKETSIQTVPVGTTYYAAFFHGTTMTVTADGTYKIIVDGTEYTPVNGVVTAEIPAAAGMGRPMPLSIQIVNEGTADLSATLEFVYPEGTGANPEDIEAGTHEATFEAGATEYYYNWTAPSAGTVTIGVTSEGGWQFVVNNLTAGTYGENRWSDSDPLVSSEVLEVAEGDVIEIRVLSYDPAAPYAAPAGSVATTVAFEPEQQENESESESESESNTEDNEENIPSKGDLAGTMGIMVVLMGAALVLVAIVSRKKVA